MALLKELIIYSKGGEMDFLCCVHTSMPLLLEQHYDDSAMKKSVSIILTESVDYFYFTYPPP